MASKRKRGMTAAVAPLYSDPTPERMAHAGADFHDSWKDAAARRALGHRVLTVYDTDPVERLFIKGRLTWRQHEAASKFRIHAERLGLHGELRSVDFESVRSTDPMRFGSLPAHAQQQFALAMSVLNPVEQALARVILIDRHSLAQVAGMFGREPNGKGLTAVEGLLIRTLDKLADLWC